MMFSKQMLLGFLLLAGGTFCYAVPGESIVRTSNGDYIVTYWNGSALSQTVFVPATNIRPRVASAFVLRGKWEILYRYKVDNGNGAKQSIVFFRIPKLAEIASEIPVTDIPADMTDITQAADFLKKRQSSIVTPARWSGDVMPTTPTGVHVRWSYKYKYVDRDDIPEGLMPGEAQSGFGYSSHALPGVGFAETGGEMLPAEFEDEGPASDSEIAAQLEKLEGENFLTRLAAVPTIAVPSPFDAALLLERIRSEMQAWPDMQLLDPAYAAQLDRYLVSAAEAYRLNNSKAAKEHIHTLRKMLAKEHHNVDNDDADDEDTEEHKQATRRSIDRLAARVLDFDLRYVLKRMEQGHDKDGRGKDDHRKDDPRKR